jgi:methyl acetate hydrolase
MQEIDDLLSRAVGCGSVPGVVAAAATADGVVYEGAFGTRVLPAGPAMTTDTVFRIASMTKAITAAAAMQLVEEERLALDAPASEVVSGLAEPKVLEGFAADGTPRLRPARGVITLRQLLTHTAGFGYDVWNADLLRYHEETGLPAPRTGRLAGLNAPLTFDPGRRWQYGINIDWVGRMVETASGENLESYFRTHIFTPLGMEDTGFVVRPHMLDRLAAIHARAPDGLRPVDPQPQPNARREFFAGGGGLCSTARDYLTFLRMLLAGGQFNGARTLRAETVATMFQNHMGALLVEPMHSAVPAVSNDVDLFPGMPKTWGLSFLINTEPGPAGRSAGSLAWAGLYNSYYWLDPVRQIAGVIFTQILPFGDPIVLDLLDSFERVLYDSLSSH